MAICEGKNVIIVCDGAYGLDIYMMILAINARSRDVGGTLYNVVGFISDYPDAFERIEMPAPLLGKVLDYNVDGNILLAMAIRNPSKKKQAVIELKHRGAVFATLVAPWVLLPTEYKTGEGCIIGNYSCKYKSTFGDFVIADTVMCESVEVGSFSTLCPFSNITNSTIGREVYIGSHAVIMEHKSVGDNSVVLPGSIVLTNVKPGSIIAGVPATSRATVKWDINPYLR